ncbi:MAG: hypothetical protein GF416_05290 [Candidatus Altiarchaeales archaeon]|nr:hypothetical protein [Candidatus Altiarchaeales archaeon]MBD3416531.1 hypothetical protein [Candidatus Altiarchaeales archaeon]
MVDIRTHVDVLLDAVRRDGVVDLDKLTKEVGEDKKKINNWLKQLESVLHVDYSINLLKKPSVKDKELERKYVPSIRVDVKGEKIESYKITVDGVPSEVSILDVKGDVMRTYNVDLPRIGDGTHALLDNVVKELAVKASIKVEEIADPKKAAGVKERFREQAKARILEEMPVTEEQSKMLAGIVLHRVYGLGDLEMILGDDMIEEICVNSSGLPIVVYQRKHGWLKSNIILPEEKDIFDYASQIGRRVGKDITNLNPLMDARLISGDRVVASMFPISSQGNTITIRKFARDPWTVVDFMSPEYNTISPQIASFLWLCIQYELSVLVAGGTASGKTSMLNSLCAFIPPGQRVVSIEDTREIQLPSHLHLNWIQLTTREPNPDGLGGVTMLDLILSSLRMRPDRIIVGEIRDRNEAEVLFEAMHTGHSVYSTMHADTCQHVRRRVTEPPIQIPEAELEALQVIMTQYRDRLHGIRRTFEVAEVVPGTRERRLELKYLYRWRVKTDTFDRIDKSSRVANDLNLYTGLSAKEIEEDLKEKESVLQWLLDNSINKMNDIGRVMNMYYTEHDELITAVEGGKELGE